MPTQYACFSEYIESFKAEYFLLLAALAPPSSLPKSASTAAVEEQAREDDVSSSLSQPTSSSASPPPTTNAANFDALYNGADAADRYQARIECTLDGVGARHRTPYRIGANGGGSADASPTLDTEIAIFLAEREVRVIIS